MSTVKYPFVAIIGRTNVGKSTLFNAMVGTRKAIVDNSPGVTRDRHYALVTRFGTAFNLIDTGGLLGEGDPQLVDAVRAQAIVAVEEADLIVAVFDGLEGLHPSDHEVVKLLRESGKPVVWAANKCEKPETEAQSAEFYSFGVSPIHFVSAQFRKGIGELADAIRDALQLPSFDENTMTATGNIIRLAIVGRPNVGKSSLLNKILGAERSVAADKPGTTRDPIEVRLERDGQEFEIVDTAGLRKKARVEGVSIERYANLRALRALAECDVAILVIDVTEGLPQDQDIKIANLAHDKGKGLIIVVNKWDAIEKDHRTAKEYTEELKASFKFLNYAPIIFTSALTGKRCPSVLKMCKQVYDSARVRLKTSEVNRIFGQAFTSKPPPVYHGEPVKLFFATQVKVGPPSFVLFVNHPRRVPEPYLRYLTYQMREEHPFMGTDIRLYLKKRTTKADRIIQEAGTDAFLEQLADEPIDESSEPMTPIGAEDSTGADGPPLDLHSELKE